MASLKGLIRVGLLLAFTIFWTMYAILRMLKQLWSEGFQAFKTVERSKPPSVLIDDWEHGMISLSDIRMHYVRAGSQNKPLLLMLHGFPEFWYSWRHQIKEFQDDYRVVAVDMRGYGDSDKPSGIANYRIPKMVNDIKELIPALGYSTCTLAAHDWGGAIAWQFVLQYPDLVDKFVAFNCPHPRAFQLHLRGNYKQMLKSWYMFFFQVPFLPELFLKLSDYKMLETFLTDPNQGGVKNPQGFTKEDIEAWKYTYSQPGALTAPINYYRAAFRMPQNANRRNEEWLVKVPTMLVWGKEDFALEESLADKSGEFLTNGSVEKVESASHWVQQDAPEQCNKLMKQFLQGM